MNTEIFESKLKRHRINYSIKNKKIILGKIKKDYLNNFILGMFPVMLGSGLLIYFYFINIKFDPFIIHLTLGSIILIGYGVFNFKKVRRKRFFNDSIKTFEKGKITIESKNGKTEITQANIHKVLCFTYPVKKDLYEGAIVIIDKKQIEYKILGLNDENERYLKNDLKTFYDFILSEIGLNIVE